MATYAEITSTKTINLSAAGGTTTLTYYAGNKEKTTGSVVGNVDKKTITYVFDGTSSWINSITLTNKDTTAKNITVNYKENTNTTSRLVNLKLKDQTSAYYLILKQDAGEDNTTYNLLIVVTNNDLETTNYYKILFLKDGLVSYFNNTFIKDIFPNKMYLIYTKKSSGSAVLVVNDSTTITEDMDEIGDVYDHVPSDLISKYPTAVTSNSNIYLLSTFDKSDCTEGGVNMVDNNLSSGSCLLILNNMSVLSGGSAQILVLMSFND